MLMLGDAGASPPWGLRCFVLCPGILSTCGVWNLHLQSKEAAAKLRLGL